MLDRVPCEIFSKIIKLSHTKEVFPSFYFIKDFDEVNVPPIKATHVCRSWRNALLSNPTMWTYITLTGGRPRLDQFDQTLYRSGTCPLHLFINLHVYHIDPTLIIHHYYKLSVISQQMHRCRQLRMVVSPQLTPFVFNCLDKPTPMLQRFCLHVTWDYPLDHEDVLRGFHETLCSGYAPNLEHLNIQIVDGLDNFRLALFKNLSSLHLLFTEVTRIKGEVLLDILQSSPRLRTLMISMQKYTTSHRRMAPISSNRRITLSHLRNLTLRGNCNIDMIDLVLGHLDFQIKDVKFSIKCEDSFHKISNSTLLCHLLSYRRFTFVSVSRCATRRNLALEFYEMMDHKGAGSRFKITSEYSRSQDGLLKFLRTFNVLDVTHMYLESVPFNGVLLRSILVSLENLQYLRVQHGNFNEWMLHEEEEPQTYGLYLKALLPRKPQRSTNDPQTLSNSDIDDGDMDTESNTDAYRGQLFPCPSLRTLEIFLFDYQHYPVTLEEAHLPALSRCSRIREQAGYPLRCIADCGKLLDLAKDMEAWLRVHGSGLSIEIRVGTAP